MLLLKLIRTIGKLIRGGATPTQIYLASLLGVCIGMIPGLNLTLLGMIALVLVFNVSMALALFCFAVGKLLCITLAPLTYQIGYAIIHRMGFEGVFRAASDMPVLAWLDLHVYCLVGAIPVAIVVGAVMGGLLNHAVVEVRKKVLEVVLSNEKLQKVTGNWLTRLLARLLFGKIKVDLAQEMQRKAPLIRKSGVICAAAGVVIVLALEWALLGLTARYAVEQGLAAAVGAEVNVAKANVSLLGGDLEIDGLQVTDPDKPTHNLVQAESVVGDLSVRNLLARRFVIDELKVSAATSGTLRTSPGKVYEKSSWDLGSVAVPDSPDWYLQKTEELKKYKRYLDKVKEYLDRKRAERERNKQQLDQIARKRGYLKRSAQDLLAKHPAWTIRKLTVDKITVGDDPKPYSIDGRELSGSPELNPNPMTVTANQAGGFNAAVSFDFANPDGMHKLSLHAPELPLGKAIRFSDNVPLDISNGLAAVNLVGAFSAKKLDLPLSIDVTNLQAQAREGKPLLGLDPQTAKEIFQNVTSIAFDALIEGTPESPKVKVDAQQLLANLKDALIKAGKNELAKRADQELGKLRDQATQKIQQELDKNIPKDVQEKIEKAVPAAVQDQIKKLPGGLKLDKLLPGSDKK